MLEGPRALLMQVTRDNVTARVNLNNVQSPANHTLAIEVSVPEGIKIKSQSPEQVTIPFDNLMKKQVPVKVHRTGTVPEGYVLDNPVPVPDTITLEGPESEVAPVAYAQVEVDVTGYEGDIKLEQMSYKFYTDEDKESTYTNFKVDSSTVSMTISMLKLKQLPVKVALINTSGGDESSYAKIMLQPSAIAVAAPLHHRRHQQRRAAVGGYLLLWEPRSLTSTSCFERTQEPKRLRASTPSSPLKRHDQELYGAKIRGAQRAGGKTVTVSTSSLYIKCAGYRRAVGAKSS